MSDKQAALDFDIKKIDQDFLDNPFPVYKAMRENDPVHLNPDGSYFLTRYEDVVLSLRHPGMSSDKKVDFKPKFGDGPLYVHHTSSLVFNDPPVHTRVRKLLSEAFTPRKLAELEPVIEGIIDRLLDRLAGQGEFDVVSDYALALPTEIIADMLGVPEEHRHKLHNYSNLILGALDPVVPPEKIAEGHAAVEEFGALLEELIADRRKTPKGGEMGEVLAALIFGEVDGEKLTPVELVQNCIFLLNAGHETTANLVGNGISILLDAPDQMQRLRGDPSLIKTAVEEFLRYQSPLQIGNRKATEDVEFGPEGSKVVIPAGSFIHTSIGAANRDPEIFEDPDRLDIARFPNPHLAFGGGGHTCAGMSLARMEGRIAIERLVARFAVLEPIGVFRRGGRARFRGYLNYPMRAA